jgi:hypothetical protein
VSCEIADCGWTHRETNPNFYCEAIFRQRYLCLSNRVSVIRIRVRPSERWRKGPARERGPNENTIMVPVLPIAMQEAIGRDFAQKAMSWRIRFKRPRLDLSSLAHRRILLLQVA